MKIIGKSITRDIPPPKFRQFERVEIVSSKPGWEQFVGERGAVLCCDSFNVVKFPDRHDQWIYSVSLPVNSCCPTFMQSELRSEGAFDAKEAHLGLRPEVSFDLVLEEDHTWMEGAFRLPGEFWKIMIFHKEDVPEIQFERALWAQDSQWEQEFTGLLFRLPRTDKIDRAYFLRAMSLALGYTDWVEVRGPDSMLMR